MTIYSDLTVNIAQEQLTEPQRVMLVLLSVGYNFTEIAMNTNYSVQTVKNYMQDARQRLCARNNEQACFLALFTGQISYFDILNALSEMNESADCNRAL